MYESFLKLKGRKVTGKDNKKYFGRLSDILVNEDTNKIIGIIAKNDSLIYRHRLFYLDDIYSYDDVCIYVKGFGERFVKIVPTDTNYKSCENDIYKKKAIFSDGADAGKIQNINFDFEAGMIADFEVGASLIQDLLNGRMICPVPNTFNYSEDSIVLCRVTENEKQDEVRK